MRTKALAPIVEISYPIGINMDNIFNYINLVVAALKDENIGKANIWCMGSSGAILAALLSNQLEESRILHVKKDGESSHHGNYFTTLNNAINIIIDDFIVSGDTVNRIYNFMGGKKCDILIVSSIQWYGGWPLNFKPLLFITDEETIRKL